MGAVPLAVLVVRGVREVLRRADAALEVGVTGVGAGVEDGDLGALAVVARGPGLGGVHLLGRPVEGGLDLGVEPELLQAGGGTGPGAADLRPEGGRLLLVGLEGDAVDGREDGAALGAARGGGHRAGDVGGPVVHGDERQVPGVRVVVALADEPGDVEEFLVDAARGDRVDGALGVDVQVLAGLPGLDQGRGAVLRGQRGGAGAARAVVRHQDPVAGDEGDDGAALPLRGGARQRPLAAGVRGWHGHGRNGRGDGEGDGGRRSQGRARYRTHRSPQGSMGMKNRRPIRPKGRKTGRGWCCGGVTLSLGRGVRG